MRSRPEISLRMPAAVHAGEGLLVDVTLECAAETPVDSVIAVLEYVEEARPTPDGHLGARRRRLGEVAELAGPGRLGAGTHEYAAAFELPGDLPPTHVGSMVELKCAVQVTVAIPWWLNAREAREIAVRRPPEPRPPDRPLSSSSQQGSEPFVEISLPRRCYAPGEVIEGAAAFGNLGGRRATALDIALVGLEHVHGRRWEGHRSSAFRDLARVRAGEEIRFRLPVPAQLTPAFRGEVTALEYVMEATLEYDEERRLVHRVPLEIGPFARQVAGAPAPARRPRVGASRWRAAWARAGRRAGLELDEGALELSGLWSGCRVLVRPGRGHADQPGLAARVRAPEPWGLDLEVRKRSAIAWGVTAAFGEEGFAGRYRARGREEAQVRAALGAELQGALLAFDGVRMNDTSALVWSAGGAQDEARLRRFLERVEALAAALAGATAALPPPSAMAEHLPAWRRFAGETGGALEVGRMRLRGAVEGVAFAVTTRFAGSDPAGTRIAITPAPPLEEEMTGDAAALAERPETRALVAEVVGQAERLGPPGRGPEAAPEEIAVEIEGPLADPAAARGVLGAMLGLLRALRRERRGGPYR